jgi:hypothetical protein
MSTTTNTSKAPTAPRFSLDTWAVAAAVLFIVVIVAGLFPRVPW